MAADAPGIQIVAINPRKAALELQPNVSRPAITRPSPAETASVLATSKANSFLRKPENGRVDFDVIIAGNHAFGNVNRTYSPHDLAITKQSRSLRRAIIFPIETLSPETLGSDRFQ